MEEKKNHPSLPSNYVTLAQLQERWLKEKERKEKEKELQEKQEQQKLRQQKLQQNRRERERHQHQAKRTAQTPRSGTEFRTGNRSRREFRPKILNCSETNRSAIEASSENHEKLEAKAENLGYNAGKDSKTNKPKKRKKVKRNPRAAKDKEGNGITQASLEAMTEGEVENFEVKRGREKTAMKNELNHEVDKDVDEKFRDLSMRCESDKQNARFRRPYSDFPSTLGNYGYGGSHSYGGYSGRFVRREAPKPRGNTMVWVRKDSVTSGGNIAGIETSSGSC